MYQGASSTRVPSPRTLAVTSSCGRMPEGTLVPLGVVQEPLGWQGRHSREDVLVVQASGVGMAFFTSRCHVKDILYHLVNLCRRVVSDPWRQPRLHFSIFYIYID